MPVQFIGMIQPHEVSETIARKGPAVDSAYVRAFAQAHEHAGFDRILVPASSSSPDTLLTVAYAASVTQKIGFLLAHRPGFVAPTLAARQLATLDHYTQGRLAVHYISGGSDEDQQRDGDFLSHDERYARTDEYLTLLRRVRSEATLNGRHVDFSISFRPILGRTEDEAWARAERILEDTRRLRVQQGYARGVGPQLSEGAQRLLADAAKGDRVDERLWTAIARELGGRSNSTSLVGTPEQVADALLKYYDLGITTFLIRGFDPLVDAIDYGRELLPLVRAKVAERDRLAAGPAALKAA